MQSNSSNSTITLSASNPTPLNAPTLGSAIQNSINNPTSPQMQLLCLAQSNDTENFIKLLENTQFDLSTIKNSKGFTTLHYTCYNNNFILSEKIITHQERRQNTAENLENFVNSTTYDLSTPLHFASFRGNLQLLQLLKQKGANIRCTNNQGLNIMHIGAQGDQPNSIVFALENGIKIDDLDLNQGSALHWACYYGQEHAVTYLLPLLHKNKPYFPLNKLDNQMYTPLHLAVINGSTRLVKKLLLYGADKTIKGKDNKTAANLAQDNEFRNIYNLLTKERSLLITYYNIQQGTKRVRKSSFELLRFFGFMIFLIFSYSFYVIEDFNYSIIDVLIFGSTFIAFLLIILSNPGYQIKRIEPLYQLIQNFDHEQICPSCNLIKMPRTKHCDICQKCVLVYDHHCPWINNCVGAGNHVLFMIFIILLDTTLIYGLVKSIIQCIYGNQSEYKILENDISFWIIMVISIFIYVILAFGITILIVTQFANIFLGQTTFERFALQNNTTTIESTMKSSVQDSLIDNQSPTQKNKRLVKYSCKNFFNFCQNKSQFRKKEKEIRI